MLGLVRNTVIFVLAFVIGLTFQSFEMSKTTLEEISNDVSKYDGRLVEVESYVSLDRDTDSDSDMPYFGEPFEKREALTVLDLKSNHVNALVAWDVLAPINVGKLSFRAKVRVVGRVNDNCGIGHSTCCFGPHMTITVLSMDQTGPVEPYSGPRMPG